MKALYLLLTIILIFITGCDKKEMAPDDINEKETFVLSDGVDKNDK